MSVFAAVMICEGALLLVGFAFLLVMQARQSRARAATTTPGTVPAGVTPSKADLHTIICAAIAAQAQHELDHVALMRTVFKEHAKVPVIRDHKRPGAYDEDQTRLAIRQRVQRHLFTERLAAPSDAVLDAQIAEVRRTRPK